MFRLRTKTRIALALVSLTSAIVMLGLSLGLIPDYRGQVRDERASLCEALAWTASALVQNGNDHLVQELLGFSVRRNDHLLSAGVRTSEDMAIEVGDHAANWPTDLDERSRDGFVHIPISRQAENGQPVEWGRLELRFTPMTPSSFLWLVLTHPWTRFGGFVSCVTFFAFFWYLGRVLSHLDPQKAVPQRVRSAYDFLTGGLVALDKNQRIVLANRAFAEIVNEPRESLIGVRLSDLQAFKSLTRNDSDPLPWKSVHSDKQPHLGTTLKLSGKGLKPCSLMVNAAPVIGQDGEYRGVLVGFDDVTPLENAKAALEKSKELAEEANVAKSAFLANMSHEIRTPMNSILGFADIMRRGFANTDKERQEYLNIIHSSGQHLLDLINDILDLSKVESGRMELELIECQPHRIVSEVLAIFGVRATEKELDLSFSIQGEIPSKIKADPLRLRQILTNLVSNALKFTEVGGVKIIARLEPISNKLAFDVIDSGIGISEEQAAKIFDPFSQADSSTTRKYGGTGLGLPISRRLAEMMGGTLAATRSVEGQGSCFTVTIDHGSLESPTITQKDIKEASQQLTGQDTDEYQLPPGKILVVDDGETNRRLIQLVCERAGVSVMAAVNGAEAVELATRESFDVILMDVMMPVMDGYEATTELRKRNVKTPIVALTAHAMKEERARALKHGFDSFVSKPVNIDELLEVVAKLMGGELTKKPRSSDSLRETSHETTVSNHQSLSKSKILCSLPLDDAEFLEIAAQFRDRLETQVAAMAISWASQDFEELAKQAHWLKGAGGTAGFDDFTVPAKQLEQAANSRDLDKCEEWVDTLRAMASAIWLPPQDRANELLLAVSDEQPQDA